MQMQQIGAMVLRHARQFFGDSNILFQMLFWPIADAFVWGFLGLWIQNMQREPSVQLAFLLGIFLIRATSNVGVLTGLSLFEEAASNNLINLFASPLRLKNWLAASYIFSAIVGFCINVFYITPFIWLVCGGSISMPLYTLKCLLIFVLPMMLSGMWLGSIALCAVVTFGRRANELIHVIVWSLGVFTTAYYPLEVLPPWAQRISECLPFAHILQAMRGYVLHQVNPILGIAKGVCLAIVYGAISIYLFYRAFQHSRVKGLARLSD